MTSSVLCRVGIIISRRIPSFQNSSKCAISCCFCRRLGIGGDDRLMSTSTPPSRTSPWLMLPPAASDGGGGIEYKFYSLAERKVLSINQSESENSLECVGSSHGWIALFNRRNNDLFLSNPLTGRQIKLPSMERVHDRHTARKWGPAKVLKLVLSSSPEDKNCCAMMIYGPLNRLAFCFPAIATSEWTPIGDRFGNGCGGELQVHEDLAYCKIEKWFSTIDAFRQLDLSPCHRYRPRPRLLSCSGHLHQWDPWDPPVDGWAGESLKYEDHDEDEQGQNTVYWVKKNKALLKEQCLQIPHIVHVDGSYHPYIAFQFVMLMNPDDGSKPVDTLPDCHRFKGKESEGYNYIYPSKTVGFVVLKLNTYEGEYDNEVVDDFDGLAMFVGINHSFALPASDFPELNPDSIYFTDSKRIVSIDGSNNVGVFDYPNKTVHGIGIFHSDDDHMDRRPSSPGLFKPSPLWFTPAAHS